MKKQILSAMLTAAMLLTPAAGLAVSPDAVYAEDAQTDAATNLQYVIENGGVKITGCDLTASDITIPAQIAGLPVRTIGKEAFYNSASGGNHVLASITLPDTLTKIEPFGFASCTKIRSVTLPAGCTDIGEYAFRGCSSLTSVNIPEGVTVIRPYTFYNCGLESLELPSTVIDIDDHAYDGCPITALELPVQTAFIGKGAFCSNQMLQYAILPGVISVGDNAFEGCNNLKAVLFSDALSTIGAFAFSYCKALESVELPDSVTAVGSYAFGMYAGVKEVNIPDSVTYLGANICPDAVEVIDGVKYIGNWAVGTEGTPTTVTLREGTVGICENALSTYTIQEVELPASLQYISGNALGGASSSHLLNIHVSADNTVLCDADGILYSKDQTQLVCYPGGREETQFTVPDTVVSIADYAFYNAANLEEVLLPDGLKVIGNYAFAGCKKLAYPALPEGLLRIGEKAFPKMDDYTRFAVPDSVISMGRFATEARLTDESHPWLLNGSDGTIPESTYGLADECFTEGIMTQITIPDAVQLMGSYTFWHCTRLESAEIGSGVIGIDEGAFGKCYSLREITLPENVSYIDVGAFMECVSLGSVTILNPDCEIADSPLTIWDTAVIYGYAGSTAQAYAEKYDRTFVALSEVRGDVNADGVFDVRDIVMMQHWLSADGTTLADWQAGDLCHDGVLDVFDLALMKRELTARS